jgi:hypothetical protein
MHYSGHVTLSTYAFARSFSYIIERLMCMQILGWHHNRIVVKS